MRWTTSLTTMTSRTRLMLSRNRSPMQACGPIPRACTCKQPQQHVQVLDEIGVEVSSQMGAASSGVLKQARCMLICRSNIWRALSLSFHAARSATQHPAENHDANSASVMCMLPQLYSKQGLLTAIPVYAYTEESGTRGDRRGRRRSLCASGCAQELNS